MTISRRGLFLGGFAVMGTGLVTSMATAGLREHVLKVLELSFGRKIAALPLVDAFSSDLVTFMHDAEEEIYDKARLYYGVKSSLIPDFLPFERRLSDWVVTRFALSTNVLRVVSGEDTELTYDMVFDPKSVPCGSPLTAFSLSA
jgi:hypothetical protein